MTATPLRLERLRAWLADTRAAPAWWARPLRTTLRTVHLLGMSAFFGAAAFRLEGPELSASAHAALLTGLLFAAFEIARAPAWLVQVRGVATLVKTGLLLAALRWPEARLPLAVALVALGSVVSHAPARIRYHSFLHGRVVASGGRG